MPQAAYTEVPKPVVVPKTDCLQFENQILNIGIALGSLFDLSEENGGIYAPGAGLAFAKKLLEINTPDFIGVNLTILSDQSPRLAPKVCDSLHAHGFVMKGQSFRFGRGEAYLNGLPLTPHVLRAFGIDLFLSPERNEVETALRAGIAAGQTFHNKLAKLASFSNPDILMVYDFDRVLGLRKDMPKLKFKGDGEAYFQKYGLFPYNKWERKHGKNPAHPASYADIYLKTALLREQAAERKLPRQIKLAILTASAGDALRRISSTMEYWGGELTKPDYLISSGSTPKAGHLAYLRPDMFIDDSEKHIKGALDTTFAVLVPHVTRPQTVAAKRKTLPLRTKEP